MAKIFKWTALAEGVSLLLILFVTMPLKYFFDQPDPNKFIGMAHGILFIFYVGLAIAVARELLWSRKTLIIVLLCSIIPFGTFWMEKKYL